MEEEWRDIKGWEGYYSVSNLGNIKSHEREIHYRDGRTYKYKESLLTLCYDRGGYLMAVLKRRTIDKVKTIKAHRIVAEAFIPNPQNKPQINHKNGVKTDNRVDNLEWCTQAENNLHNFRVLGRAPVINSGSKNKNSKPVHCYDLEGNFIQTFESACIAAKTLKCDVARVCEVSRAGGGKVKGYFFKYVYDYSLR